MRPRMTSSGRLLNGTIDSDCENRDRHFDKSELLPLPGEKTVVVLKVTCTADASKKKANKRFLDLTCTADVK